mgnify:CR=1 FL=1
MNQGFPLFPESASTFSDSVDSLYFFLIAVALFFSALICVLIAAFTIKYRRRSDSERPVGTTPRWC